MKTLVDHLAQYAAYHRDRRSIFSHFIGIPMIVLSIAVLLARPALGFGLSPALLLALAAALFYLRLWTLRFGVAMTALLALTVWGAVQLAAGTTAAWLGWGVGLFVVGWIIQFRRSLLRRAQAGLRRRSQRVDRPVRSSCWRNWPFCWGCRGDLYRLAGRGARRPDLHSRAQAGGVSGLRERGRPGWERYLRSAAMRWRM